MNIQAFLENEKKKIGHVPALINTTDLSSSELNLLMDTADDIMENPLKYQDMCKGKTLGTLFFEPSTRTRLSFEAAMKELGGNVIGFSSADSSSSSKGETVEDTIRIVSNYVNIIAMRHPAEGAALAALTKSLVPLINAGDGGHFHPTQTLTDLLTIRRAQGRLDNLKIGLCGDLKYGRTVHSLISALTMYDNISIVCISPDELALPKYVKKIMQNKNMTYTEVSSLEAAISDLDVLYMTRIQRERFDDINEYERLKDSYVLTGAIMANAKENLSVLHPLPRVNEIEADVDDDPRALYFFQALSGKHIRMALILYFLGLLQSKPKPNTYTDFLLQLPTDFTCTNKKCISNIQENTVSKYKVAKDELGVEIKQCAYCDK